MHLGIHASLDLCCISPQGPPVLFITKNHRKSKAVTQPSLIGNYFSVYVCSRRGVFQLQDSLLRYNFRGCLGRGSLLQV